MTGPSRTVPFLAAGTAPAALALALALALPAAADEAPCPMTYAQYEFAVPHLDLEDCPAALAGEDRFCRASVAGDRLHVFAFAEDGAQCLLAMESFDEDAFALVVD